jgi:hypothetical protein
LRLIPDAKVAKVFGRAKDLRDAIEAWRIERH